MGRHALGLIVLGLLGCSRDWTIGNGTVDETTSPAASGSARPTPADASTIPVKDAGVGGASPTSGECGPSCACTGNAKCRFTCAQGPCSLACSDNSNCKLGCAQGAQCAITCTGRSECDMDCTAGGNTCSFTCRDGADCSGDCARGGICTRDCTRRCDVACTNGAICP